MTARAAARSPRAELLEAWVKGVDSGSATQVVESVLGEARASGAEVLLLDGDMVFGTEHLVSALFHATKATEEGRNSSDSLAMETLLYASGERQLSSAIDKMSVDDTTQRVVLAVLRGTYAPGEGWSRLPQKAGAVDKGRLMAFGVSEAEMGTVGADELPDLVLEKVAAVDVIKR